MMTDDKATLNDETMKELTGLTDDEYNKRCRKEDAKEIIKEFEQVRYMAELKALSKVSLERPLNDDEFKRMMELKEVCLG